MRKLSASLLALALALQISAAAAQTPTPPKPYSPPSPEEMRKMTDASMETMVPMMTRMAEVTIEAQLRIAEKPETATRIARFKKNLLNNRGQQLS